MFSAIVEGLRNSARRDTWSVELGDPAQEILQSPNQSPHRRYSVAHNGEYGPQQEVVLRTTSRASLAERRVRADKLESAPHQISAIKKENSVLKQENSDLQEENSRLKLDNSELKEENSKRRRTLRRQNPSYSEVVEIANTNLDAYQETKKEAERKDQKCQQLSEELEQQRSQCQRLEEQLSRFKAGIATSSRVDKQISDDTIQKAVNNLYYSIQTWALRLSQPGLCINFQSEGCYEFLIQYVPDCANGSETATIHACMATVSIVIKDFVNSGWVFGPEFGATTELATALWRDGIDCVPANSKKKKQQWLVLTDELLSGEPNGPLDRAGCSSLNAILDRAGEMLENVFTLRFTDRVRKSLADAIQPQMHLLRMLHFQEATYSLEMALAQSNGVVKALIPESMEDVYGKTEGPIKASIFPALFKKNGNDAQATIPGSINISKAKVVIE